MHLSSLRQQILDRAIRGQLVEQRPEEGTAEELYQQIQAEKKRLIANGTIKKEKHLPTIEEKDLPFDIPETWKWVRLASITYPVGNKSNQILSKDVLEEGDFRAVSQGESLIDGYTNEKDKVITDIPLVMFGDHTRNVKLIDFPFVISADGTKCMKPISIEPSYLYYWMSITAEKLRNRGYARHFSLLNAEPVSLPPLAEQKRIVEKVEALFSALDTVESSQKRIFSIQDELTKRILNKAIQGKLVPQRPEEGTAEDLYQQIQAEKQRLIASGTLKKEKPLPPIEKKDLPFDIPETWKWVRLASITYPVGNKSNQILSKDVLEEGDFPAVSQGESLIDGYTNEKDKVITDIPLVMFGDHTRNVKLIDFPFVISADGTKFMKPIIIEPSYLYYWMSITAEKLRNRGYARHFSLLNAEPVSLPPLAEQKRIVAKIEVLLQLCQKLQ